MGDLTRDFGRHEFACNCGCGYDAIDLRVVDIAQAIRDALGEEVRVNSGCRCTWWNEDQGGVQKSGPVERGSAGTPQDSFHTTGMAADLACDSGSVKLFVAVKRLFDEGKIPELEYCQHYPEENFVHIDVGRTRNNRFAG